MINIAEQCCIYMIFTCLTKSPFYYFRLNINCYTWHKHTSFLNHFNNIIPNILNFES